MSERVVRQVSNRITELEDNLLQLLKPSTEGSNIDTDTRGSEGTGGSTKGGSHQGNTGLVLQNGDITKIFSILNDINRTIKEQKAEIAHLKERQPHTANETHVSQPPGKIAEITHADILRAKQALKHVKIIKRRAKSMTLPQDEAPHGDRGESTNNSLPDKLPKRKGKRHSRSRRRSSKDSCKTDDTLV